MNPQELTGQARTHVVAALEPAALLHTHAVTPLQGLRRAALRAGFDLTPVSAFRDFDRQLAIWNGKFNGLRPLYGAAGQVLDALQLTPADRVDAILRWSALPGASRHHWGTDVDVIDARAVSAPARDWLTAGEFAPGGPFAAFAAWLDENAARYGFFRPYRGVRSGVQAEPWHLSFAPVAENARRALTPDVLRAALEAAPLEGKEVVLGRLDELHARYAATVDFP